jgi:hypothetical protein
MSVLTTRNLGTVDRSLRAILGAAGLLLAFVGPASPWGYLGIVLLATAAIGFCPLYAVFGISTRARQAAS